MIPEEDLDQDHMIKTEIGIEEDTIQAVEIIEKEARVEVEEDLKGPHQEIDEVENP